MPLWTTTSVPLQSVWGWALSSDGRPWVAHRVCPIPMAPVSGRSRRMPSRFLMRPAARRTSSVPDGASTAIPAESRSEEHTSELQSLTNLVCRLLLEKKKYNTLTLQHYAEDERC